ncbi:MAG: cysteine--tRNA ligase [Acidobacteriota bacterium]|nr:cysteine--tRNA ligase [Blastocatellia bacterium]MDW8412865.1 cysteine--tRNA ligase [Acidobacteriota bacterium]
MLRLYNTLSKRLEPFTPLQADQVSMYACGPTVHDYAHIGNFRTFMFVDLLRRYLKFKGYKIRHVMNITDIDDKTIRKSQEQGIPLKEYTELYTRYFLEDLTTLGAELPEHIVPATENIPEMIDLIKRLEANGHTYVSEGSVYYRIASFAEYGKLSGAKLAGNVAGARVDVDEYDKEDARDFVLWKAAKEGEPFWETPYGRGRPGWHLECSAMAMKYLGESFDIHCGGVDLIFPHHENEIAQSEGATGRQFVRFWLHCEHLLVEGQKMSKSLGNYYTLRDLLKLGFSASAIRLLLLSVPYRKQLNFTLETLRGMETRVKKLSDFRRRLKGAPTVDSADTELLLAIAEARKAFEDALDEDLNTSAALAAVADFETSINRALAQGSLSLECKERALRLLSEFDAVFGVLALQSDETESLDEEILRLIEERTAAKAAKNYARADEIRRYLFERGIILEDTKTGVRWRRV